ncbi:MAG: PH domain-containing protein [Opitutales bacterium]|nr:PH domain-containing protein [Opitutales bacterium]
MKTRFKSAVDVWVLLFLVGTPVLLIALGASKLDSAPGAAYFQMGFGVLVGALIALLSIPCYYDMDDQELTIRGGFFAYSLPLNRIHKVELANGLWVAPALSVKRICIVMDDAQSHMISPKDREAFIRELEDRCDRSLRLGTTQS